MQEQYRNNCAECERSLAVQIVALKGAEAGKREADVRTVGLIVQDRQAWHLHVRIIHLAARMVSTA